MNDAIKGEIEESIFKYALASSNVLIDGICLTKTGQINTSTSTATVLNNITIKNVNFGYSDNPVAGIPAMMDFLEPMKGQGLIFNYVNKVDLENVTFNGVSSEEVALVNVDSFNRK